MDDVEIPSEISAIGGLNQFQAASLRIGSIKLTDYYEDVDAAIKERLAVMSKKKEELEALVKRIVDLSEEWEDVDYYNNHHEYGEPDMEYPTW